MSPQHSKDYGEMCNFVFSIQEFLKVVPGLAIFPLSFYLAWKKLGVSVSASYTINFGRLTASRIGSIVLYNNKDRPVPIYAVHAMINRDIVYEVDKFDPPLILKPLEALSITTSEYSSLYLANGLFEPQFSPADLVEIYLETPDRMLLCKDRRNAQLGDFSGIKGTYQKASKHVSRFNGVVYNDNAAFAITYRADSHTETAIVDNSGFIGNGWEFRINHIPEEALIDKASVRRFLETIQFDNAVDWFVVDCLRRT